MTCSYPACWWKKRLITLSLQSKCLS